MKRINIELFNNDRVRKNISSNIGDLPYQYVDSCIVFKIINENLLVLNSITYETN